MEVRPRRRGFRENVVLSLNKITWTFSLELHMSVNIAQDKHFIPLVCFVPPKNMRCFHAMFSEGTERDREEP